MGAAVIREADVLPEATPATVARAVAAIKELLQVGERYSISWVVDDAGSVVQSFRSRAGTPSLEAWLLAQPVDDAGNPVRGREKIAFTIACRSASPAVTARLRRALERAVKADEYRWVR